MAGQIVKILGNSETTFLNLQFLFITGQLVER